MRKNIKLTIIIISLAIFSINAQAANRSYLYSFNYNEKGKIGKIFDISEQNYSLPIIYKILVSSHCKIVPSKIFEGNHALVGNAREGRKRLNQFFSHLIKEKIYDENKLKNLQNMFLEHLDKYTLDYFLFEPAEVIAMEHVDINTEIVKIKNEIRHFDSMIKDFMKTAKKYPNEWSSLGIDFSNYSYFSLGDREVVKTIENKSHNKKRIKLEKTVNNKPSIISILKLVTEMDNDKEADKIDKLLDTAVLLKTNYKQLKDIGFYYKNLDKKLAIYQQMLTEYPNEEAPFYWIASIYENKKEYKLALEFSVKDLLSSKELGSNRILQIENIIEKGNFSKQKIYEDLSKQITYDKIELSLIHIYIENGEYEKAFKYYKKHRKLVKQDIYIIWWFFRAKQIKIAILIAEETNNCEVVRNYYRENKMYTEAVYWQFKHWDKWGDIRLKNDLLHLKGDVNDIHTIFKIIPDLSEFKIETILKVVKQLNENNYPKIAKRIIQKISIKQKK